MLLIKIHQIVQRKEEKPFRRIWGLGWREDVILTAFKKQRTANYYAISHGFYHKVSLHHPLTKHQFSQYPPLKWFWMVWNLASFSQLSAINSELCHFLTANWSVKLPRLNPRAPPQVAWRAQMGGNSSSLSCSCFSFSSAKSHYREEEDDWEWRGTRKIRPSDEDGTWGVGERDVDLKASDFIAKFHESRFMDPEHITV